MEHTTLKNKDIEMLIGERQEAIFRKKYLDIRVTCSSDARLTLRILGYEFEEQREEVEKLLPELRRFHATLRSRGEKEQLSYWVYGSKGRKANKTFVGVDNAWAEFEPPEGWELVAVLDR